MPTSGVTEPTVTALGAAVLSQFDQYRAEAGSAATAVAVEPSYSDIEYLARTAAWLDDSDFVFSAALPGSDLRLVVRLDELGECAGNRDEAFSRASDQNLILERYRRPISDIGGGVIRKGPKVLPVRAVGERQRHLLNLSSCHLRTWEVVVSVRPTWTVHGSHRSCRVRRP